VNKFSLTKMFLIKEYIDDSKSLQQIANRIKCCKKTIWNNLKKYNIPIRTIKESVKLLNRKGENNPSFKDGRYSKQYLCINCNKKISRTSGLYGLGRCKSCVSKLRIGNKSPNWNNGSSFEPYPLGWTKTFKEQIRYRDNYRCQICGCPEVECIRKLHVHHIDYDKNNILPDNLTSLCNSCHNKTNGNREYWETYFQTKRKEKTDE